MDCSGGQGCGAPVFVPVLNKDTLIVKTLAFRCRPAGREIKLSGKLVIVILNAKTFCLLKISFAKTFWHYQ
jgi:hypothetical protein